MEKREKMVLFFSLAVIALSAVLYFLLPKILESMKPHNPNFIGLSTQVEGDVKVRFSNSITWKGLDKKEKIFANSYLFTGPNSSASFAFLDKSIIKLGENSMISLNFQLQAQDGSVPETKDGMPELKIGVLEGKVDLNLNPNSQVKSIQMDETEVEIGEEATSIHVESGSSSEDVTVLNGQVSVKAKGETKDIKAGEKVVADYQEEEIKKEEVPDALMEEMKRMAAENYRLMMEEERKKREFTYLLKYWYSYVVGDPLP